MNSPTTDRGFSLDASGSGPPRRRETDRVDVNQLFATWGEAGTLLREGRQELAFGPVAQWPTSLRTALGICLGAGEPALICWGPQLALVYNDACRPLFGARHPGSFGARASDVWRDSWTSLGPLLQAALERGEATRSEAQLLRLERNGCPEDRYFTFSYTPIRDEAGAVCGVYCAARDTTEQVCSDRRLETLTRLAECAAQASSTDEACRRTLAVLADSPDEFPIVNLYLIDADGKRATLAGTAGASTESERAPREVDASLGIAAFAGVRGLGQAPLPLVVGRPDRAAPAGFLVVGSRAGATRDAKQHRFLELVANQLGSALARVRALDEASDRVLSKEQAVRFSETFVGVLGHELRNPLSAITTAANLLEMRAETDKIKKPVARILSSADRMDHMISQLLDFTRIRLGRGIHLGCQRVDLYELSREVMDQVAPLHRKAIRLESGGDVVGLWDRERLSQLLSTLVSNACQHGSEGSQIVLRIDGASLDTVRVEVRNDGVVPSELLPFLFEPLRQNGDHAEKRDGSSGLGLGLYISKQIVLAHGGRLSVESSAEQGTRFAAELPRWGRLDVANAEAREAS